MRKIKYDTIGVIPNELNFPHVKAVDDGVPNYSFGVVDLAAKTFSKATAATGKGIDVGFIDVTEVGDEVKIFAGDEVNFKALRALDGRIIVLNEDCITYAAGKSYDDIVAGTTLLGVGTDRNAEVIAAAAGYAVYLKAIEKIQLLGNAVKAQVIVA